MRLGFVLERLAVALVNPPLGLILWQVQDLPLEDVVVVSENFSQCSNLHKVGAGAEAPAPPPYR